ncbi:MAG TPA: hypothetical protein VMU01_02480 [Rhizomicrobium sp.]|nr:hypothetical protein [Rhizomicrobium sp.]
MGETTTLAAPTVFENLAYFLIETVGKRRERQVKGKVGTEFALEKSLRDAQVLCEQGNKVIGLGDAAASLQKEIDRVSADTATDAAKRVEAVSAAVAAFRNAQAVRDKRSEQLKKDAAAQIVTASRIQKTLADPKSRLPRDDRDELRDRMRAALADLYAPDADLDHVKSNLDGLSIVVESRVKGYTEKDAECRRRADAVGMIVAGIAEAAPREAAPLDGALNRVRTLIESAEYPLATEQLDLLLAQADDTRRALEAAAVEWPKVAATLPDLLKRAETLATSSCPLFASAPPLPATAVDTLKKLTAAKVGADMSPRAALTAATDARAQIEANEARQKEYDGLDNVRRKADEQVAKALAAYDKDARKKLDAANDMWRKRTGEYIDTLEPYASKRNALAAEWEQVKAAATIADALDPTRIVAEIDKLRASLDGFHPDDGGRTALEAQNLKQAKVQFEKTRRICEAALAQLEPLGAATYADLSETLATHVDWSANLPSEGVNRETAALETLVKAIEDAIATARAETQQAKQNALKPLKEVEAALKAFDEKLARYDTSFLTKSPEYKKYAEVLRSDYNRLAATVGETDDKEILAALLEPVGKLRQRLRDADSALDGRQPPGGASLEELTRRIEGETARLGATDISTYLATTKQQLLDDLEKIKANVGEVPMDESQAALAAWAKGSNAAFKKALAAKAAYEAFVKEVEAAEKRLGTLAGKELAGARAFVASLTKQLAVLKQSAKPEGGLAPAQTRLTFLIGEMDKGAADPAVLRGQETAAQEAGDAAVKTKERWRLQYAAFRDDILGKLEGRAAPALIKEIAQIGEQADTSFEKSQDYDTARQILSAAIERAHVALAMPEGIETLRTKLIPEVLTGWRAALKAWREGLDAVAKAVAAADAVAEKPVQAALQDIWLLFNPAAFDAPCRTFAAPGASERDRRAAREVALQEVRRVRGYLDGDPRFGALLRNPFVSPFTPVRQVNTALNNIEKTLLTGF